MAHYNTAVLTVRLPINRGPYIEFSTPSILTRLPLGTGTYLGIAGNVVQYGYASHTINHAASALVGRVVKRSAMIVGDIVPICTMTYVETGYTRDDLVDLLANAYPTVRFRVRRSVQGRFPLFFETSGTGEDFAAYAKLLGFL